MASVQEVGTLRHNSLLALVWSCFAAAFLFVSLRMIVRLNLARKLSAEDYWTFLALASLLTLCILETIQLPSLYYMTGVQAGTIPVSASVIDQSEEYLRFQFPIVILYWTVLWCVKAGFLALYFKLFRELPIYRRIWYGLAAFTFLTYAGCWVSLTISCGTISNFFKFNQCGTEKDIWVSNLSVYYSTVVDVLTDLCIMAMPLRLIYNVKISLRQKLGLVSVFALSFVMISFSIIRANQVLVPKFFVNLTLLMVWSTLAASISVIVGSLPAFKLFLTKRSATRHARNGYSNGSNQQQSSSKDGKIRHNTGEGGGAVPLSSFSSTKSASKKRYTEASISTEDILKPGTAGSNFSVVVKHDIEIAHSPPSRDSERPYPIYQPPRRQPGPGYMGRAF